MTDIRYISTKEAAEIMGLSTRRVVGLYNAGKLEGALRKGRNWMVPEETVYAYLGTAKPKEGNGGILSCAVGNGSILRAGGKTGRIVSGTMDIVSEVQKSIIPGLLPIISIITVRRNHIGPIPVIMRSFGKS